jgi:hypothetical protein
MLVLIVRILSIALYAIGVEVAVSVTTGAPATPPLTSVLIIQELGFAIPKGKGLWLDWPDPII